MTKVRNRKMEIGLLFLAAVSGVMFLGGIARAEPSGCTDFGCLNAKYIDFCPWVGGGEYSVFEQ